MRLGLSIHSVWKSFWNWLKLDMMWGPKCKDIWKKKKKIVHNGPKCVNWVFWIFVSLDFTINVFFKIILTIHMQNCNSWKILSLVMGKKAGGHTDCVIFPSLVLPYPLDWFEWFNLMMQICRYCYLCWYSQSCQGLHRYNESSFFPGFTSWI